MRWPWQRDEDEMPSTPVSGRDERLSAYLDGALTRPQRAEFESEMERDTEVQRALEGMRAVRASLGSLGFEHAPRSFALQPGTVKPSPALPRLELFARVGAVAAALVLTVVSVLPSATGVSTLTSKPEASSSLSGAQSTGARDAATVAADARKQAEQPSGAAAKAPVTANESAPAAAPASSGGAAPAAPQAAPPSSGAPSAPETPSKAAIREPAASATPLPPVPLQRLEQGPLWLSLQIALAVAASALGLLAAGFWLRRRGWL